MTAHPSDNRIVIVGAGGHARVVSDLIRRAGQYRIAGYLDGMNPGRRGASFADGTILGGLEQLERLAADGVAWAFVAVGDCDARLELGARLAAAGFRLPALVHPSAVRGGDVQIGDGTVLVAGAIVNPGARIGSHVIINTGASVDHDCLVDDGVHIACGARLAGRVQVGRGAWIGLGALVKEGVHIGAGTIVGAGALVLKDLPDDVVAYGVPAKIVDHVSRHHAVGH
jgi:acetyltransferase EpsM